MAGRSIVIGGGITGLSAAWALARRDGEITLVNPGPLGGLLRTERIHGCTVECGADSWIRTKSWLRDLTIELGLSDQIIPCNEAQRGTYILKNGKLLRLPRGLRMFTPSEWLPLLQSRVVGWPTKLRMLGETLRRPSAKGDRSVAEFVRDHFGDEALEYLAEPLFAGVYGGSPETLGVEEVLPKMLEYERTRGSLIRGVRSEPPVSGALFESMREGLGQIPQALTSSLQGRVQFIDAAAEAVEAGRVRVAGEWMNASQTILACGAPAASQLLLGTAAGELLGSIPHSSATIYAFGFHAGDLADAPRGFGFLTPRRERHIILAGTWTTNKFEHRAPQGKALLRCFVAGNQPASLLPRVLMDLKRITGVSAQPFFARVYPWAKSMPQYGVGHARLVAEIESKLPPRIRVAGAYLRGVGMPDCVREGMEVVCREM